jgi:hypothetical protein
MYNYPHSIMMKLAKSPLVSTKALKFVEDLIKSNSFFKIIGSFR